MKILITGAGGQLGHELVAAANKAENKARNKVENKVVGLTRAQLDVTDRGAVQQAVTAARPQVIIHAAAWTAVDACEGDAARAMLVNATATQHVVDAARDVGARVVYISTDYVFDGTKPDPYLETDTPNPQSVYGVSKLAGEQTLDPELDSVVRISWVCGYHGANMVKTILRLAAEHDTLTFVDDQIGNPTMADDAARMIVQLATEQSGGVWHVTNQGVVSWFGFACEVLRAAGLDPARVRPIRTCDLVPPRPAPRPANSVLENRALRDAGIAPLGDFHAPLSRLVKRLRLG